MAFLVLVTGSLVIVALGGGIGAYLVANKVENQVKDIKLATSEETRVYYAVMKLLRQIQEKKVLFEPRNSFKTGFLDEFTAGSHREARMTLLGGYEGYHRVAVFFDIKKVISFHFYQDGKIENIDYSDELITGGDMKVFALELKQAMDMYIRFHAEKIEQQTYAKHVFENINNLTENEGFEVSPVSKVEQLIRTKFTGEQTIVNEVEKTLRIAKVLHKLMDLLNVEEKHTLQTFIEDRLYGILFHYSQLNKEEKEERYNDLLKGIAQVHDKLSAIADIKRKGHELEFEKHLKMIDK